MELQTVNRKFCIIFFPSFKFIAKYLFEININYTEIVTLFSKCFKIVVKKLMQRLLA